MLAKNILQTDVLDGLFENRRFAKAILGVSGLVLCLPCL